MVGTQSIWRDQQVGIPEFIQQNLNKNLLVPSGTLT